MVGSSTILMLLPWRWRLYDGEQYNTNYNHVAEDGGEQYNTNVITMKVEMVGSSTILILTM